MAYLVLEDGTFYEGELIGNKEKAIGEVVFNTSMMGYGEILTDKSNKGKMIVMTYPIVGGYGVNEKDLESDEIEVNGLIVREIVKNPSNFMSQESLNDYLIRKNKGGISGVDTRAITKNLRDKGSMRGLIVEKIDNLTELLAEIKNYEEKLPCQDFKPYRLENQGKKLAVIDLGAKKSVIENIHNAGFDLTVYSCETDSEEILKNKFKGVIFTNGYGNPILKQKAISLAKNLSGKLPIVAFGLGHEIMALANGMKLSKLKYGHRGCNHPIKELRKDKFYICNQNHSFVVDEESVTGAQIILRNWNDMTIEGLVYSEIKAITVEFEVPIKKNPLDASYVWDEFVSKL